MPKPSVAIRLGTEGKAQVKSDFREVGDAAENAALRLGRKFEEQSAAAERAATRAAATAAKIAAIIPQTPVQMRISDTTGTGFGQFEGTARASAQAFLELERAEAQLTARTHALIAAIDPAFAAQQRFNAEMLEARTLVSAGALSLDHYVDKLRLEQAALDAATHAQNRNGISVAQQRAMYQNLGFQVQDVTQQIALGTPPMIIMAQQGGQVAFALSGMQGRLGAVAAFLSGPWGAALMGAALITGVLASKLMSSGDEADKKAKKVKTLKEAIEELNEVTGRQIKSEQLVQEELRRSALLDQKRIDQIRDKTKALLSAAIAELEVTKTRSEGFGTRGEAAAQGLPIVGAQIAALQARLDEQTRLSTLAKVNVANTTVPLLARQVRESMDAGAAATGKFERAQDKLNAQFATGKITAAQFVSALAAETRERDRAIEAARKQAQASRDAEKAVKAETATVKQARAAILDLYPNARITSTTGGKHSPNSHHYKGRAIDLAAIDGVSFEEFVASIKAKGFKIVEAIDEYKNPSKYSSGGHWHIAWTGGREAVQSLRDMTKAQDEYARQLDSDLEGVIAKFDPARKAAEDYAAELARIANLVKEKRLTPDLGELYGMQASADKLGASIGLEGIRGLAAEEEKAAENRGKFIEQAFEDQRGSIALLKEELGIIGASEDVRRRQLEMLKYGLDLKRDGLNVDDAEYQRLMALEEMRQGYIQTLVEQNRAWDELTAIGENFIDTVLSPSNWTSFGDMGKKILRDLQEDLMRLALINPLKNMLFGQNNATLGNLGSLFGGGGGGGGGLSQLGNVLSSLKASGFAMGTEHFGGGAAWIAENGPELVTLPRGSKITPAAQTRRMMAANDGGMNVPVNINIDATGADAAGLARVEAKLDALERELPGTIVSTVNDARGRRMVA